MRSEGTSTAPNPGDGHEESQKKLTQLREAAKFPEECSGRVMPGMPEHMGEGRTRRSSYLVRVPGIRLDSAHP